MGLIRRRGYELRPIGAGSEAAFIERAHEIVERHDAQTRDDVAFLTEKYRAPVFGRVRVWEVLEKLALCIDPGDTALGCVSQLTHSLQVAEGLQRNGISDPDLILAALLHDIGKVLLLTGEDPANVGGCNSVLLPSGEGAGLASCVVQWNHDEFGYSRLKDHVPDHVAWLVRYHSARLADYGHLMDARDRQYYEQYYGTFTEIEGQSKALFGQPRTRIEDYRALIDEAFPEPIPF